MAAEGLQTTLELHHLFKVEFHPLQAGMKSEDECFQSPIRLDLKCLAPDYLSPTVYVRGKRKNSLCMCVSNIFIKCVNGVCTADVQTCSQNDLDVSFTVCDFSTELASSQSARNITSPISAPCILSCYGIWSSTGLIYFPFLCHTWQTILSSPIWPGGASSREMPRTWEHFSRWAGCWSNCSTPGALQACEERLTPLWPPENEVEIEKTKLQYPLDIEMFLAFSAFQSFCKGGMWTCLERIKVISPHTSDLWLWIVPFFLHYVAH